MKKLLIAACMMFGFAGIAAAQAPAAAKAKKPTELKVVKKDAPAAKVVKMEKTGTAPVKADGTPDMRFKANKAKAKAAPAAAGPTKKDGTADMRFKANKKKA